MRTKALHLIVGAYIVLCAAVCMYLCGVPTAANLFVCLALTLGAAAGASLPERTNNSQGTNRFRL